MNAFERLIDRSLFTGLGLAESPASDGQEASNSWTLLQALLRQNEQARSYTTRLLLKKAREQPGIRPPSMDRLHALLELWPMADREPLLAAFGELPAAMSPGKSNAYTPGTSTPPRRPSRTPEWGPPFSESPALPGARRHGRDPYGLEDSAMTVQIRSSRNQALGESAATARQGTSNSLDAWIAPGTAASQEDLAAQMRRTRSLPATAPVPRTTRSWAPQLVLDFGPSGSSEDDRARRMPWAPPPPPPPAPETWKAADVTRRRGPPSSGSSGEQRRRSVSQSKRQILPNAPSESEDEVTLEPEAVKPVRKRSSRSGSKREVREESGEERRPEEAATEKLHAKVRQGEAAVADAEAKSLQALAEAKASALSKEQAEAQAVAALAEARALVLVKDEAEARCAAAAGELVRLREAKEDAEASLSIALAEARASVEAKQAAEAQVAAAVLEAKNARNAKDQAEAAASGALAELRVLAEAKATAEAQRLAALAEAKASLQAQEAAEARAQSAASQAEVAVHTRQAAEAKAKASAEALAAARGALSEATASAEAWAAEAREARNQHKAKEASQQQLVTMYAEARCRCLASMLAQLRRAQLRGAWVTLAQQRWEQRFAREATKLHEEHQTATTALRSQLEEQLRESASERRQLLQRCGDAVALRLQLSASLWRRRLLVDSFGHWQKARELRLAQLRAAQRLARLVLRHAQRRNLQTWRQQAEEGRLTYLEVQIDCFESFTAKRNSLTWRVLNKCGGYWAAEQQDLTILAVLEAWRKQVQEAERRKADFGCGCHKLADVGLRLLRRHLWAPWTLWQQAEQRAVTSALRQVEECHARKEAELLKMELEQVRLQASAQRDVFAAEMAQMKMGRAGLEESSAALAGACGARSWRRLAAQCQAAELRALLRAMASVLPRRSRARAAAGGWRGLGLALLARQPCEERSAAACCAVQLQRRKRREGLEVIRQAGPVARLAALGVALRRREAHSLSLQLGRCLRALHYAQRLVGRLARLAVRCALRTGLGAWRGAAGQARAAQLGRERWQALLSCWSSAAAVQDASQERKLWAGQQLLKLLASHVRRSRSEALARWRRLSWATGVETYAERRITMHCESKRCLRLERGVSLLAGLVKNRMQMAMAQALLGQWRIIRWQAMVRSLDDSVTRDHCRMTGEFELLRNQLVQSQDEALQLQGLRQQEEQEAQMALREAQDALLGAKKEISIQETTIRALEHAKAAAVEDCDRLRCSRQQAESAKVRIYQQQLETLQQRLFLGLWRRASQAQQAEQARRGCAAQLLGALLAATLRGVRRAALERWRAQGVASALEDGCEQRVASLVTAENELRRAQGLSVLANLVQRRLRQALLGHWRLLKWQAAVRSLDASFARDQRRMLAEAEALRGQLAQRTEETRELRALQHCEQERSLRTREEAEAIVEAVKKERASQAGRLKEAEATSLAAQELTQRLQEQLDQALAEVCQLDAEKRSCTKQMCVLHSELAEAQAKGAELAQAEAQRERAHQEQVQQMKQQALRREAEWQDQALSSEKALEQRLHEKQRAVELQSSIAEDQEKNIRHLEDLLKEQGEQLARERNEHQRASNALRASASLSESKTSLLQEQVVALRQQLQREHRELMASEKAWSSDRAALLSAVSAPNLPSGKRPRRKASPGSPKPGAARCPWHQRGKLAPALM